MGLLTDEDYIHRISGGLRNFKRLSGRKYECSCPSCGDSAKDSRKARGSFYIKGGEWKYHCFNCGYSASIGYLIADLFPEHHSSYTRDTFRESGSSNRKRLPREDIASSMGFMSVTKNSFRDGVVLNALRSAVSLPSDHPVPQYLLGRRKLPTDVLEAFWYASEFKHWVNSMLPGKFSPEQLEMDEPRVVIPFFNKDGLIYAFQGRAIEDGVKPKYYTIKFADSNHKIYNAEQVDRSKPIKVTEGLINSLFLSNAVATNDANLIRAAEYFKPSETILVWDNEPRNEHIRERMTVAIGLGYRVVIWPNSLPEGADINDLVKDWGYTSEQLDDIILKNSFKGIKANVEYHRWINL